VSSQRAFTVLERDRLADGMYHAVLVKHRDSYGAKGCMSAPWKLLYSGGSGTSSIVSGRMRNSNRSIELAGTLTRSNAQMPLR